MLSESKRNSLAGKMKSHFSNFKLDIKITLTDDQKDAFVPQYTSLDEINGEVSITASSDTTFDEIYITFEGVTCTVVERLHSGSPTNTRSERRHSFLRLHQPQDFSRYSNLRILKAGEIYKFLFTFVVPDTLLPDSCTHTKQDTFPEGGHLRLPPSLGDPQVSGVGKSLMEDMAPDMCNIVYSIRVRISRGQDADGRHNFMFEEKKKLRIIPAVEEQPPLDVTVEERYDYKMRKEKDIKKGIFKGKLGHVIVQSTQPKSLKLPYFRGSNADCNPTTMATLNVRFYPFEDPSPLPSLSKLQAKLIVFTGYASEFLDILPTKASDFYNSNNRGIYVQELNLSSLNLSNIKWQKQTFSTSLPNPQSPGMPSPSWSSNGEIIFYTAMVIVPVSLPKGNKVLVPSFHSCLVSRIYVLDLNLTFNTPNKTIIDPYFHLRLPFQVSSEGNPEAAARAFAREHGAPVETDPNDSSNPQSALSPVPEYTENARPHAPSDSALSDITSGMNSLRATRSRQRFQPLGFEGEETPLARPPEYDQNGGANRQRVLSNAPSNRQRALSNAPSNRQRAPSNAPSNGQRAPSNAPSNRQRALSDAPSIRQGALSDAPSSVVPTSHWGTPSSSPTKSGGNPQE